MPQGSIISPLLFLLYINYLLMNIQRAETGLFTDDINILLKDENGNILNWKLKRILKDLTS